MVRTGMVQEGGGGITNVAANSASYRQGIFDKAYDLYAEFDVPATVVNTKGHGWGYINGPNSPAGRLATRQGRPVPQMPEAMNIKIVTQKD